MWGARMMTNNEIIKALECCIAPNCGECPIFNNKEIRKVPGRCIVTLEKNALDLINRQKAEIKRLTAFKSYFDELYGKGLDIANWHKNGDLEPFDSFYNSALEEMAGEG